MRAWVWTCAKVRGDACSGHIFTFVLPRELLRLIYIYMLSKNTHNHSNCSPFVLTRTDNHSSCSPFGLLVLQELQELNQKFQDERDSMEDKRKESEDQLAALKIRLTEVRTRCSQSKNQGTSRHSVYGQASAQQRNHKYTFVLS